MYIYIYIHNYRHIYMYIYIYIYQQLYCASVRLPGTSSGQAQPPPRM